jgi:exo-beta-1,3-glucanase (GH17 family)
MKEVQLKIIAKVNVEIAYRNKELWNFKEERRKLYEEIEMRQEIVNAKNKANKDLEETMERSKGSYNELWGKVHVKEQIFNKGLHAKDVKLQSLELIHKTLGKLTYWEKTTMENQAKAFLYEQLVGKMEPNVKTTLE